MTEEEEEEYQRQMNVDDQNLVNVDGTKLKLSVKLIKVLFFSLSMIHNIALSALFVLCST